jgi:hypothetical protein
MKLLIAEEDDAFLSKLLEQILASDYELVPADNVLREISDTTRTIAHEWYYRGQHLRGHLIFYTLMH